MDIYGANALMPPPNYATSAVLLRSDLHAAFDNKRFVFVPKSGALVTHVIAQSPELLRLYHNTKLHQLIGVAPEFILVRFAWTIFGLLKTGFLRLESPRNLIVVNGDNEQQILHQASYDQVRAFGGMLVRSRSPKKRSRNPNENILDEAQAYKAPRGEEEEHEEQEEQECCEVRSSQVIGREEKEVEVHKPGRIMRATHEGQNPYMQHSAVRVASPSPSPPVVSSRAEPKRKRKRSRTPSPNHASESVARAKRCLRCYAVDCA